MELRKIEKTFQEIKPTVQKNKELKLQKEINGEFFNLFSILKVERNEVHTHSAFLAELLNPKGTHGNKGEFLRLFIQQTHINNIKKEVLKFETAIVTTEKYIGKKDVKNETGGDIDILIKFEEPDYLIIIENKIDAGDQEVQLARYHNYAKKYGNAFTLFYLTKDGHEPSEWSIGKNTEEHYWTCISYKKDIKQWLEKCLIVCSKQEIVNSSIKQYITLINKLTGQELNEKMKQEILDIMLKYNDEMLAIWENLDDWQWYLVKKVIKETAEETNCECIREDENYNWWMWDKDYWIAFVPKNAKDCKIWFGKEPNDSPYYYLEKKGIKKAQKKLECMSYDSDNVHPYGSEYLDEKYSKWGPNVAKAIINGKFKNYLKNCITEIVTDPNFPK